MKEIINCCQTYMYWTDLNNHVLIYLARKDSIRYKVIPTFKTLFNFKTNAFDSEYLVYPLPTNVLIRGCSLHVFYRVNITCFQLSVITIKQRISRAVLILNEILWFFLIFYCLRFQFNCKFGEPECHKTLGTETSLNSLPIYFRSQRLKNTFGWIIALAWSYQLQEMIIIPTEINRGTKVYCWYEKCLPIGHLFCDLLSLTSCRSRDHQFAAGCCSWSRLPRLWDERVTFKSSTHVHLLLALVAFPDVAVALMYNIQSNKQTCYKKQLMYSYSNSMEHWNEIR